MVFVIAECGVNWRTLSEADGMIKAAAEAGADACKFQAYKPEQIPHTEPRCLEIRSIALGEAAIRYLYWRCQQHGIEFMCTPMYPEAVAMLNPYVKRWKVRYADRENRAILDAIVKTGKEALISGENMFCIPEYPPGDGWNLYPDGFEGWSCHIPFTDMIRRYVRVSPDLKYLEVHVRLDRYDPAWDPIDQRVSITMSELRQLCKELGR